MDELRRRFRPDWFRLVRGTLSYWWDLLERFGEMDRERLVEMVDTDEKELEREFLE